MLTPDRRNASRLTLLFCSLRRAEDRRLRLNEGEGAGDSGPRVADGRLGGGGLVAQPVTVLARFQLPLAGQRAGVAADRAVAVTVLGVVAERAVKQPDEVAGAGAVGARDLAERPGRGAQAGHGLFDVGCGRRGQLRDPAEHPKPTILGCSAPGDGGPGGGDVPPGGRNACQRGQALAGPLVVLGERFELGPERAKLLLDGCESVFALFPGGVQPRVGGGQVIESEDRREEVVQFRGPAKERLELGVGEEGAVGGQPRVPAERGQRFPFLAGDLQPRGGRLG